MATKQYDPKQDLLFISTPHNALPEDHFCYFIDYDAQTDTYTCPAGERLKPKKHKKKRKAIEYSLSKRTCMRCELRDKCTRSKNGARKHKGQVYTFDRIDKWRIGI